GNAIQGIISTSFTIAVDFNGNQGDYSIRVQNPDNRQSAPFTFNVIPAGGPPACNQSLVIGAVTIRANCVTQIDSRTFKASGNVSINNFLRFDGEFSIIRDGINATVSGSG